MQAQATVEAMKELLLCTLEAVCQAPDVSAQQQMGVSLTNAVKRDGGVVIVQNQSVEVFARVIPSLTKAIRLCDQLVPTQRLIELSPAPMPPAVELTDDPIDECCAFLYEQHMRWQQMQDVMKARYLEYVVGKFRTKTEAAKWLGVGLTYLCKLTKAEKEIEQ
jgi:hypothetical protein